MQLKNISKSLFVFIVLVFDNLFLFCGPEAYFYKQNSSSNGYALRN